VPRQRRGNPLRFATEQIGSPHGGFHGR
jgi:hypothetical protein